MPISVWDDDGDEGFIPLQDPLAVDENLLINSSDTAPLSRQTYQIGGIEVKFPFHAYQNQLDMMEKVQMNHLNFSCC